MFRDGFESFYDLKKLAVVTFNRIYVYEAAY